jgi:Zn-dependent protease
MQQTVLEAAALIVPLIVAIVFHEVAHGWVARALGDPTAHEQRRLSLNPLRHVDPMGTIMVPGFLALTGLPTFGWAKPVPVNKLRLRNPRFGMMLVAAAGPLTNLALAFVGAVLLGLAARAAVPGPAGEFLGYALQAFLFINVSLALFNLLPIPPLDGSALLERMLPARYLPTWYKFRPYGLLLLLVLIFWSGLLSDILDPIINQLFNWVFR